MICNLCGKHNATIYFKGLVNGQAIKLHLCEGCAKKKGMMFPFGKSIFSLGDMIAGLAQKSASASALSGLQCPLCGLHYAEFKQSSQMGCSRCYATFASVLGPLLQRLHGHTQHVGKTAASNVRGAEPLQELSRLKLELRNALKAEQYESAAVLRDQIRSLETRLSTPSSEPKP